MTGVELLVFVCYGCGQPAAGCPECVTVVLVDPVTGHPPDVANVNGKTVRVPVDPAALARSVRTPICDGCINARNASQPGKRWDTGEQRHGRAHF
jgi:hypothetical protein